MYNSLINGIKIEQDIIPVRRIIALVIPHKNDESTQLLENPSKRECIDFIGRDTHDIYVFKVSPVITENDLRRELVFKLNTRSKMEQTETEQGQMYHIELCIQSHAKERLKAIEIYKNTFKVDVHTAKNIMDEVFNMRIVEVDVLVYDERDIYRFCAEMKKLNISAKCSTTKNYNQDGKGKSM